MQFDNLSYGDFNPHLLYIGKKEAVHRGKDHAHDYLELTYILKGQARYNIQGETHILKMGDLLIGNPGVVHRFDLREGEEPPMEVYIGVSNFHLQEMPQQSLILPDGGHILHCRPELKQDLNQLIQTMISETQMRQSGQYFMIKAYLVQLLLLIVRQIRGEKKQKKEGYVFESRSKGYVVKRIITYMNENYNSRISLDQIAQNMYLSPVYISKIFKEETGESPIRYLIQIRLEKAKEILEDEDCGSIKDVAQSVGYEDVYYFSKLFKKYYGIAPAYYKKGLTKKRSDEIESKVRKQHHVL